MRHRERYGETVRVFERRWRVWCCELSAVQETGQSLLQPPTVSSERFVQGHLPKTCAEAAEDQVLDVQHAVEEAMSSSSYFGGTTNADRDPTSS